MTTEESAFQFANDFQAIVESIPGIVFIASTDQMQRFYFVNEWIEPILGYTVEEWLDTPGIWVDRLHPDDRDEILATEATRAAGMADAVESGNFDRFGSFMREYRMLHKDGRVLWVRDSSMLVRGMDGSSRLQGVIMEITEQKLIALQLERRSAAQAAVATLGRHALASRPISELLNEACRGAVDALGIEHVMVAASTDEPDSIELRAQAGELTHELGFILSELGAHTAAGYTLSTGLPLLINDWDAETHFARGAMASERGFRSSILVRIEQEGAPWGLIAASSVRADAFSEHDVNFISSVANTLADAIGRRSAEDAMEHRALHDALTGLPNRVLFVDRLAQALERSRRYSGALAAILFVDLDHFKQINDTLGHQIGDALLVAVAGRLREFVRPTDTVARFGGDEFGLLLEEISSERDAIATAERIASGFSRPFTLESSSQFVTASIGIALASGHEVAQQLLRDADAAMYRAKQRGRARYHLFDDELRVRARARSRLESDLQRAIELRELRLEYQPIVRLETEQMYACEVLLRWDHRQRGTVPSSDFIPIAEESGLIDRIGQWVLREALRDASAWHQTHPEHEPLCISINISAQQLQNPRFPEILREAIAGASISPSCLNIELGERVLREDNGPIHRTLREIKRMDVRLLIHDFGTGASSLTQLATLPIDAIKVNPRSISAHGGALDAARIAQAAAASGIALELGVVGVGVESAEEVEELRRIGCKSAQGYLYSGPLSATAIAELMDHPERLRRTLR